MNEKIALLKKINELNKLYLDRKNPETGSSESILEKMDFLLKSYLKTHPQDTEIWLKVIMVEFTPPWEDYDRIEKYVNCILEYDEDNIQGLLILAYAQYIYRGGIQDDLFIHLQNSCNTISDKELLSLIYLAIAWYHFSSNTEEYEKALLKSIFYCNKFVENYVHLGRLYLEKDKKIEGKKMIQHALANVRTVYVNDYDYSLRDITSITSFFDEYYKGTHVAEPNLESMRTLVDDCCKV